MARVGYTLLSALPNFVLRPKPAMPTIAFYTIAHHTIPYSTVLCNATHHDNTVVCGLLQMTLDEYGVWLPRTSHSGRCVVG